MKTFLRVAGVTLLVAVIAVVALAQTASAGSQPLLPLSPLSGGVLMAQAVHQGRIVPGTGNIAPHLTCSPAPCLFTEVNASSRSQPANENPIAVDPNNTSNLLTGANDYSCSSIQGFYATTDGGTTWARNCMNLLAGSSGAGDPATGYDLSGTAYITGIDIGAQWQIAYEKSTDHGVTWSTPKVAVSPLFPSGLTDKEWVQIDDTSTSPFKNYIYISVSQFDSSGFNGAIGVAHSSDGGATWKNVQASDHSSGSNVIQFSDLGIAANGTVYVTWLQCPATGPTGDCGSTTSTLYISKSTDGGNTWSAKSMIASVKLAPDSCGAFYGCLPGTSERVSEIPSVDVDRSGGAHNGRVYVDYYNWTGAFMQVLATYSDDGGATWIPGKSVAGSSQTHDQFFQWLNVSATGQVALTWLDRRLDAANHNYNPFGAVFDASTGKLSKNVALSTVASNPNNDGFGSGFMGDYDTNVWAGKSVYMAYCATHTGTCQDWVAGGMWNKLFK